MKIIYNYFKKFFKYFNEGKKDFIKYSLLSFCAALMELIGVALIYPLIIKILSNSSNTTARNQAIIIGLAIITIFILKNIFMIFFIKIQAKYTNTLEIKIKERFMNFLLSSNYQDTYKISLAEKNKIFGLLIPNIMNNFIFRLLNVNINFLIFAMISILLALKFPLATLITVICAYLLIKIQSYIYKPLLTKTAENLSKSALPYNQTFNETALNLKSIKISNNEKYFYEKFIEATKSYYMNCMKQSILTQIPPYIIEPFVIVLLFILLLIISLQTYTEPEKLIASFALIASAVFRLTPTVSRIQVNINGINSALPMVKEFIDIYEKYEINDKYQLHIKNEFANFSNNIELKNVSFGYSEQKEVLHNINLIINKGDFIGIAGLSGAGKTTLVDIISGLFKPQEGSILIDGQKQTQPLNIGYIPQDFVLISGTIRDNVAFGKPIINDDKVIDSLKKAQLYDYIINSYKNGIYENPFIDSIGFSQGQKQRLAIARALYSDPDILILDEATSSLDLETEDEICHVLNKLKGEKTIIVIAHRLSTIKYADRIVFLENATISDVGRFDDLEKSSEKFKNLINLGKLQQ